MSELKSDSINGIEDILTNKCIEVMDNLEYKNLRSVRQAFFHINQLLEILGSDRNDEEYISMLVEYYLVVFFQQASGKLKKEDVIEAINKYYAENTKNNGWLK